MIKFLKDLLITMGLMFCVAMFAGLIIGFIVFLAKELSFFWYTATVWFTISFVVATIRAIKKRQERGMR